jgi:hypothetical protein
MAIPTPKNPKIDAILTSLSGTSRVGSVIENICVFRNDGNEHSMVFTDELSRKEFTISGMCQTCQDSVFGTPNP